MNRTEDALLLIWCCVSTALESKANKSEHVNRSGISHSRGIYRLMVLESSISTSVTSNTTLPCGKCGCTDLPLRNSMLMNGSQYCPDLTLQSRKIEHVITLYNDAFFDNSAIPTAAMGLADYWNASFLPIHIGTLSGSAVSQYRSHFERPNLVIVLVAAFGRHLSVSDLMGVKHQSSILLCYGSDTLYAQQSGSNCEFDGCNYCDMFLDLVDGVVLQMRANGLKSSPWIWTPSSALMAVIENQIVSVNGSYIFARDSLFLKTRSPVKLILLFSLQSEYRVRLREALSNLQLETNNVFEILDTKSFVPPESVFDLYSQAFITLSTTAVSPAFIPSTCRSVKGFRDWIAPSLASFLVTDDHPDNVRKYGPGVFYYKFGDFDDMKDVVKSVWNEMRRELVKAEELLYAQRLWVRDNVLDIQLKFAVGQAIESNPGSHTWFDVGPCSVLDPTHPLWVLTDTPQDMNPCVQ